MESVYVESSIIEVFDATAASCPKSLSVYASFCIYGHQPKISTLTDWKTIRANRRCVAMPRSKCPWVIRRPRNGVRMAPDDPQHRPPHDTDDPLIITSDDAVLVADLSGLRGHRAMVRVFVHDFRPSFGSAYHSLGGVRTIADAEILIHLTPLASAVAVADDGFGDLQRMKKRKEILI